MSEHRWRLIVIFISRIEPPPPPPSASQVSRYSVSVLLLELEVISQLRGRPLIGCPNKFLNVLVGAFNQEKSLFEAFFMIVKTSRTSVSISGCSTRHWVARTRVQVPRPLAASPRWLLSSASRMIYTEEEADHNMFGRARQRDSSTSLSL